jgi:hypothetical protein
VPRELPAALAQRGNRRVARSRPAPHGRARAGEGADAQILLDRSSRERSCGPPAPARCRLDAAVARPGLDRLARKRIGRRAGWISPATARISVVLPAPLAPTQRVTPPSAARKETPCSTLALP